MDKIKIEQKLSTDFIPESFMEVAEKIVETSHQAYFVGGAIRDKLLNKEVHDFDLTVSLEPEALKGLLIGYRIIDTGIDHGTVTVLTKDGSLEITTFRKDVISPDEISDHRHPSKVVYGTSLIDDLARRDFTVNALALAPSGDLIDQYDGIKDLNNHLIRAVGVAEKRLDEDALRILRALRFASCLGFNIEDSLKEAIFTKRALLKFLSVERIDSELARFIEGKGAGKYLTEFKLVFNEIFPYFETLYKEDFWQFLIEILSLEFLQSISQNRYEFYRGKITELNIDCEKVTSAIFNEFDEKIRYKILFILLALAKQHCTEMSFAIDDASNILLEKVSRTAFDISMSLHGPKNRAEACKVMAENLIGLAPGGLFFTKKRFLKYKKYELDFRSLLTLKFELFETIMSGCKDDELAREFSSLMKNKFDKLNSLLNQFELELESNKIIEIKDLAIESRELIEKFNLRGKVISETLSYLQDCCLKDINNNRRERLVELAGDWLKEKFEP